MKPDLARRLSKVNFDDIRGRLEARVCVDSFAMFMRRGWHVIEATRAMLPSVAIDGSCAAAQAVAEGRIKRLAVSMPPGTSKSLVWAVGFPAWLKLRSGGTARTMVGSYSWDFATRDSRRCRDLVMSDWYQRLVNAAWHLRADANRDDDWWTNTGGRRMIVSVGGKALGERCTTQLIDDALSGADIHSAAAKKEAVRWVNEVLPSRLEDPENDPRIMVGQRLSVDDPISEAIRQGWKNLYLPAVLAEGDEPCVLLDDNGVLVWRDTRKPGEALVSLLGPVALARLQLELGSTAFAAQYLQRPADDSASTIKRAWWRFYRPDHVPADARRPAGCEEEQPAVDLPDYFERITIAVDLTFGSLKGDYAVVSAWGANKSGRYLLDQWRKRAGFEDSVVAIEAFKQRWPQAKVLIEKAANGAATIETLRKKIPGVIAQMPIGKKPQRLSAVAPTVESGCCFLPLGAPWLADFIEELAGGTAHDDQSDTAAYALLDLNLSTRSPSVGGFAF